MTVQVGCSGWQYAHWRDVVYPQGLPQRLWLEHYAQLFGTVEVNNTFYRLPKRETFESWGARTPEGFVFAVKMSRYLSHIKRLREPAEPVSRFQEAAAGLGPKLAVVLIQLPPDLRADPAALDEVLTRMGHRWRVAVEPRHESWWTREVEAVLRAHDAALCWSDRRNALMAPLWRTAEWGYIRLHEGVARPRTCYGAQALRHWADRIAGAWDDAYVYFNNDGEGCAVRNGLDLIELLDARGTKVNTVAVNAG